MAEKTDNLYNEIFDKIYDYIILIILAWKLNHLQQILKKV